MSALINSIIISSVREAGHWGVLRNRIIDPEVHKRMAELVGMQTSGAYQFRYGLFADDVKELNPKAISALCLMFGFDRSELEAVNRELCAK